MLRIKYYLKYLYSWFAAHVIGRCPTCKAQVHNAPYGAVVCSRCGRRF